MQLQDAITDYLNHIRHERGLAKTTCSHYTTWLHHFSHWLAENGHPDPNLETVFIVPVLRRYQYAKARTGIRPRTMHSVFHSLRGLGEFLVANGLIDANPTKDLTLPKKDAAIRLTVTDEDVQMLFQACERLPKPRQIVLTRAVLSVLCYGGLRRQEVCDLQMDDVHLNDKSLLVRSGKGSKSRRVFVCQNAVNALAEWLAVREPDCQQRNAGKTAVTSDSILTFWDPDHLREYRCLLAQVQNVNVAGRIIRQVSPAPARLPVPSYVSRSGTTSDVRRHFYGRLGQDGIFARKP